MEKSKKLTPEIIRFIVVGIIATLVDLIFNYLLVFLIPNTWNAVVKLILCNLVGFIAGVIVNYLFSIFWVFQDVNDKDKKKSKTAMGFIFFAILSAIGFALGTFLMWIFNVITNAAFKIDLYSWQPEGGIGAIFTQLGSILTSGGFWLFTVAFCIKTLIVLVYNYISRKKLIFKKDNGTN